MSKDWKSPLPFVKDIMDSIGAIEEYCANMTYEEFLQDKKTRDAVVRNLEVIGEAAKNIPKAIRGKVSEVPWKSIVGMRDKLIHGYFGVSYPTVWETVRGDLPMLKEKMKALYEVLKEKEEEMAGRPV